LSKLRICRTVLFVAVILSLLTLAPLSLVVDTSYSQISVTFLGAILKQNLRTNPAARPNFDYPGELMLAANLVPVANYFCFALKQVLFNGGKTKDYKVIGSSLRLYLVKAVIFMFYIFYRNSRTGSEEDSRLCERYVRKAEGRNDVTLSFEAQLPFRTTKRDEYVACPFSRM
jgi:hypothetical protein